MMNDHQNRAVHQEPAQSHGLYSRLHSAFIAIAGSDDPDQQDAAEGHCRTGGGMQSRRIREHVHRQSQEEGKQEQQEVRRLQRQQQDKQGVEPGNSKVVQAEILQEQHLEEYQEEKTDDI